MAAEAHPQASEERNAALRCWGAIAGVGSERDRENGSDERIGLMAVAKVSLAEGSVKYLL